MSSSAERRSFDLADQITRRVLPFGVRDARVLTVFILVRRVRGVGARLRWLERR